MRLRALLFFLASSIACFGQSSIAITNLAEKRKLGREFVQELLSQRPAENASIDGVMRIRDAKGTTTNVPVKFEITLAATNWLCVYTAADRSPLGPLEVVKVVHVTGQPNTYEISPAFGTIAGLPGPGRTINGDREERSTLSGQQSMIPFAGSDFWVADLGLEFLHWPEQRMIKKEMRRSQFCMVLESVNPQPAPGAYSKVISWIDHDSGGMVHAEAYDANNKLLKEFDPNVIKKIKGEWQLREMEIRNRQTGSRTRIEFNFEGK